MDATAEVRDKLRRDDLEDDIVESLIADLYKCNCDGCLTNETS